MKNFYKNKKILITGHSGFKGSWISLMLKILGNEVIGLSDLKVKSGFYKIIKNKGVFKKEIIGDITNPDFINKNIINKDLNVVFHFAAQGLVSEALKFPEKTIKSNILGTYNILHACNENKKIKTLVIATTDKVYYEHNLKNTESYKLGGKEFYSASKAGAEHIIKAFINTKKRNGLNIGVVRAGNVLGGGDYGKDRLLTDIINSLKREEDIYLRNPSSIRPWQYILDSIYGYLLVGFYCNKEKKDEIFNLNSTLNNKYTVSQFVSLFVKHWGPKKKIKIMQEKKIKFYESDILKIDSTKAKSKLGWSPVYEMKEMCNNITMYEKSRNKFDLASNQINDFLNKIN